jgi:hypothetical protein
MVETKTGTCMKTSESETVAESDAIRSNIEQTRESMDNTLEQIGERMKPRHLLDDFLDIFRSRPGRGEQLKEKPGHALSSAGDTASRLGTRMVYFVREHPIPVILIGTGIAWALIERNRGNGRHAHNGGGEEQAGWEESEIYGAPEGASEDYVGKPASGMAESKAEQFKEKGRQLGKRVSEGAHVASQKAGQITARVAESARRGYQASRAKFVEASDAHPLTVGVGFLAAGILAGLALPHSRPEDRLVGPASDRIKARAKAEGENLLQKGKHVASAAAEAAKETAAKEGFPTSQTSPDSGSQAC